MELSWEEGQGPAEELEDPYKGALLSARGDVNSECRFFRVRNDLRDTLQELSGQVSLAKSLPHSCSLLSPQGAIWLNCLSVCRRLGGGTGCLMISNEIPHNLNKQKSASCLQNML